MTHPIVRTALFVPASRPERIPAGQRRGRRDRGPEDAVEHLARTARAKRCATSWARILRRACGCASTTPPRPGTRTISALRGKAGVTAILLPKAESLAQARHAAQTGCRSFPSSKRRAACSILRKSRPRPAWRGWPLAAWITRWTWGCRLTRRAPGSCSTMPASRCCCRPARPGAAGAGRGVSRRAGHRRPARAASRAQQMGFGGMLCIHPAQVPLIHQAFAPAAAELDWARRVLAAHRDGGPGAFMLDGAWWTRRSSRGPQVLAQAGESV